MGLDLGEPEQPQTVNADAPACCGSAPSSFSAVSRGIPTDQRTLNPVSIYGTSKAAGEETLVDA